MRVEVDAVLEAADGRIAGFKVKAAETVRADDFDMLWARTKGRG